MVFVKGFQAFGNRVFLVERFGNHHAKGVFQRPSGHVQEFQDVVKRSRIGFFFFQNGKHFFQVFAENFGFQQSFAGLCPQPVAFYGIDFPVVGNEPEGLGQRPRGEGVGTETGMHQRYGRFKKGMLQVRIVTAQLPGGKHPFVNHGFGGKADDVKIRFSGNVRMENFVLGYFADDIQFAFQVFLFQAAPVYKNLFNQRLGALGYFAQHFRMHRHTAYFRGLQPFLLCSCLQDFQAGPGSLFITGQKQQAGTVRSGRGNIYSQLFFYVIVGNLQQNAGAIAAHIVCPFGAPVVQVAQYFQSPLHDVV